MMALTIRDVDSIRLALDNFKEDNSLKTDSAAIKKMVLSYSDLEMKLLRCRLREDKLEEKCIELEKCQDQLSLALRPFLDSFNQVEMEWDNLTLEQG
jgi:hypothetical protein